MDLSMESLELDTSSTSPPTYTSTPIKKSTITFKHLFEDRKGSEHLEDLESIGLVEPKVSQLPHPEPAVPEDEDDFCERFEPRDLLRDANFFQDLYSIEDPLRRTIINLPDEKHPIEIYEDIENVSVPRAISIQDDQPPLFTDSCRPSVPTEAQKVYKNIPGIIYQWRVTEQKRLEIEKTFLPWEYVRLDCKMGSEFEENQRERDINRLEKSAIYKFYGIKSFWRRNKQLKHTEKLEEVKSGKPYRCLERKPTWLREFWDPWAKTWFAKDFFTIVDPTSTFDFNCWNPNNPDIPDILYKAPRVREFLPSDIQQHDAVMVHGKKLYGDEPKFVVGETLHNNEPRKFFQKGLTVVYRNERFRELNKSATTKLSSKKTNNDEINLNTVEIPRIEQQTDFESMIESFPILNTKFVSSTEKDSSAVDPILDLESNSVFDDRREKQANDKSRKFFQKGLTVVYRNERFRNMYKSATTQKNRRPFKKTIYEEIDLNTVETPRTERSIERELDSGSNMKFPTNECYSVPNTFKRRKLRIMGDHIPKNEHEEDEKCRAGLRAKKPKVISNIPFKCRYVVQRKKIY